MFAKKRIVAFTLAATMAVTLALTSCAPVPGADGSSSTTGTSSAATPDGSSAADPNAVKGAYPGTADANSVTVDVAAEPPKMNSIITSDAVSFNVIRHILFGLTTLDKEDKPIPGVAKDWTISEDGLIYTFNLNDTYKWSNGDPVTAKDFEYAFKSLIDPAFAAVYANFGFVFKNAAAFNLYAGYEMADEAGKAEIVKNNGGKVPAKVTADQVGIKVINDYTLELTLENPVAYLLDLLAFGVMMPVNQAFYEKHGEQYGTEAEKMLTNGPYKLTSWEHDNRMVLDKNTDFPGAADIKIPQIIFTMMTDANTRMNAFKAGELDLQDLDGEHAAQLNDESQPVYTFDDGSVWYLQFNTKNPLFANANMRKALTYAVNSASYVENIVLNPSIVAEQYVPLTVNGNKKKFAEESGTQYKSYDLAKAKELLELAKKETGITDIKFTLLGGDGIFAKNSLAFFQESWKTDLGITVDVDAQTFKSRLAMQEAGEFDVVMAGWSPDYNDPLTYLDMFETTNANNYGKYSNPEYDKLIADSRTEPDRDKRFDLLMKAEKILIADDMAIGPYYFRAKDYTTSDKLVGVVRTAFQDLNLNWAEIKS